MVPDGPALRTLYPRIQNVSTILTFEALRVEISVQSSNSRSFGLSFFRHNWLRANTALGSEELGVAFRAVDFIFLIRGERLPD